MLYNNFIYRTLVLVAASTTKAAENSWAQTENKQNYYYPPDEVIPTAEGKTSIFFHIDSSFLKLFFFTVV